ncbi:MAG TPA: LOG family protein [Planctomycetota bacterium]|nr:LOG family protein [Planctomycetota bacterium]
MAEKTPGGSLPWTPTKRALKAYENPAFLKSRDARIIRMMCEYLEPLQRFQRLQVRETVVLFGSARARPIAAVQSQLETAQAERRKYREKVPKEVRENLERLQMEMRLARYYEDAAELSRLITVWAKSLQQGNRFVVCSGGGPGIMEAANRGATERAGGKSIGLTISLPFEQSGNPFITPELLFEFHYFFMRKLWFVYMAAALVIFPGGFGTMDELFEVLTLIQTRKITRPLPVVLYGRKFWGEFVDWDALVRWGTISAKDLNLFKICDDPREAFNWLSRSLLQAYPKPMTWGPMGVQAGEPPDRRGKAPETTPPAEI